MALAPSGAPAAAGTVTSAAELPAVRCAQSLATFVASAANTVFGDLFGIVHGLGLDPGLDGSGVPVRRLPPTSPSPVPEPDHNVAPPIGGSIGPAQTRRAGPAAAMLPTRWTLGLVLGRGLHVSPAVRQPDLVPLQVERPG